MLHCMSLHSVCYLYLLSALWSKEDLYNISYITLFCCAASTSRLLLAEHKSLKHVWLNVLRILMKNWVIWDILCQMVPDLERSWGWVIPFNRLLVESLLIVVVASRESVDSWEIAWSHRPRVQDRTGLADVEDKHWNWVFTCGDRETPADHRAQDERNEQSQETGSQHPRAAHWDGAVLSLGSWWSQKGNCRTQVTSDFWFHFLA